MDMFEIETCNQIQHIPGTKNPYPYHVTVTKLMRIRMYLFGYIFKLVIKLMILCQNYC